MIGPRALVLAASWIAAALGGRTPARAAGDPAIDRAPGPKAFLWLAVGPAFAVERWSPEGGSPGARYTGWAPALDLAVGRRVRPRLAVAADLQVAPIVDRTEVYRGGSYPLVDTLHFVDTLSAIVDDTLWRHPRFHVGGGVGLLAATDVDTHMGSTATNWGVALSAHAGYSRPLGRGWSLGAMARVTVYRFGSDAPPPASSLGILPALLVTFGR